MRTLEDIFKSNKSLLNEPEVIDLINQVEKMHKRTVGIAKKMSSFHDFVLDKLMYSEVILIKGKDSKQTIIEILEYINKMK